MSKLEGPATVEGDTLIVSVYNQTDWHLSELAVALTIVKKSGVHVASIPVSGATGLVPAVAAYPSQEEEVRPEKNQDCDHNLPDESGGASVDNVGI